MAMSAREIENAIRAALPDAAVTITDLAGDGDHYAAMVVSGAFKGKTRVQQHKMVYDALSGPHGRAVARAFAADLGQGLRSALTARVVALNSSFERTPP